MVTKQWKQKIGYSWNPGSTRCQPNNISTWDFFFLQWMHITSTNIQELVQELQFKPMTEQWILIQNKIRNYIQIELNSRPALTTLLAITCSLTWHLKKASTAIGIIEGSYAILKDLFQCLTRDSDGHNIVSERERSTKLSIGDITYTINNLYIRYWYCYLATCSPYLLTRPITNILLYLHDKSYWYRVNNTAKVCSTKVKLCIIVTICTKPWNFKRSKNCSE